MSTAIYTPEFILPAKTFLSRDGGRLEARPGMEMVDFESLGFMQGIGGGERGYHAAGDVITKTADGTDLNKLWADYQDMLAEHNRQRDALVNFLTYRVTQANEDVYQGGTVAEFEEASEYGEPVGYRPSTSKWTLGYTFKWYDMAARFTWQFLADADTRQVDAVANMAAEADNRNVFNNVLKTLFNNTRRTNKEGNVVYPFYSGVAGDLPPTYGTRTFADNHNHFVTSGAATVDPGDLDALIGLLTEHGYNATGGYEIVIMINEAQEGTIRQFRSTANGGTGTYDFVPAVNSPVFLLPTDMRTEGGRPPASYRGMDVVGAYGIATIVKNAFIPAGYMVAFATGGEANLSNPVGIREHPNAGLRGLRLVKGRTPDYPLIDSFYNRGFGTGVRHRGAGAVMQITANATYAVPAQYAW